MLGFTHNPKPKPIYILEDYWAMDGQEIPHEAITCQILGLGFKEGNGVMEVQIAADRRYTLVIPYPSGYARLLIVRIYNDPTIDKTSTVTITAPTKEEPDYCAIYHGGTILSAEGELEENLDEKLGVLMGRFCKAAPKMAELPQIQQEVPPPPRSPEELKEELRKNLKNQQQPQSIPAVKPLESPVLINQVVTEIKLLMVKLRLSDDNYLLGRQKLKEIIGKDSLHRCSDQELREFWGYLKTEVGKNA